MKEQHNYQYGESSCREGKFVKKSQTGAKDRDEDDEEEEEGEEEDGDDDDDEQADDSDADFTVEEGKPRVTQKTGGKTKFYCDVCNKTSTSYTMLVFHRSVDHGFATKMEDKHKFTTK